MSEPASGEQQPPDAERLRQLARIYGRDRDSLAAAEAARLLAEQPQTLADAIFEEAAASDDVTSIETAIDYLEARLSFFAGLLTDDWADAVRLGFRRRLDAWR